MIVEKSYIRANLLLTKTFFAYKAFLPISF